VRKPRTTAFIGALLLVPALAACGGSSSVTQEPTASGPHGGAGFVDVEWQLQAAAIDSVDLSGFGITIAFTDTDVSGSSGVNRYAGTFTSSPEGAMDVGPLAVTAMAGPEDAMRAEQAYLALLDTVTGYTVTDAELDLYVDEQEVLTYAAP
jgi:heat shock protein HslJ